MDKDLGKHWKLRPVPMKLSDLGKIQDVRLEGKCHPKTKRDRCFILDAQIFFFPLPWRSAAAISVKDSNGTFISTLNLLLYNVSSSHLLSLYMWGVEGFCPPAWQSWDGCTADRYFTETVPSERAVMSIKSSVAFIFHLANLYIFIFANPMICSDDYAPPKRAGPTETLLGSSWRGEGVWRYCIRRLHLIYTFQAFHSGLAAAQISRCQTPVDAICRWKKKKNGGIHEPEWKWTSHTGRDERKDLGSVTNTLKYPAGLIVHSAAVHPHGRSDPEDAGVCSRES